MIAQELSKEWKHAKHAGEKKKEKLGLSGYKTSQTLESLRGERKGKQNVNTVINHFTYQNYN